MVAHFLMSENLIGMKHFLLFFSLLGCCYVAGATIYYSRGVVAPNLLSSWNSNRLGGGATPTSFINPGDEFVIQAEHVMYTSASWVVGSPSSALRIENGGILHATFSILLSGSFQILDGGIYYHDNIAAVTSGAGTSIFGGNELFSQASTVEIRKWINHTTPLPSSITWGNLVINYDINLGGNWNQQGVLTNIQGNFSIKRSGVASQDFRLTNNVTLNLFVGGNMEIGSATLMVKDGNAIGSTAIVQVQGDITINDGILNLGFVDIKPNNEFRFKGNLFINGNGSITSQSEESLLVANNTGVQSVFSNTTINASIKIVPGARVKLNSPLVLGTLRALVVAGTLQAGTNAITMNGGSIVVPGGYFRSSNKINMKDGVCQVCQGNGSFSFANGWCAATGDTGVIEYNTDTILFNQSLASALRIGAQNSKGEEGSTGCDFGCGH